MQALNLKYTKGVRDIKYSTSVYKQEKKVCELIIAATAKHANKIWCTYMCRTFKLDIWFNESKISQVNKNNHFYRVKFNYI